MKKLFVPILLLFAVMSALPLMAQNGKGTLRLEVPAHFDVENFHLASLGENGLMIFYEGDEINKEGKRKWYFGLFDTRLKQKWLTFVPLTDKLHYLDSQRRGNTILFLFINSDKVQSDYGFYEIVKYNIVHQKFSEVTGSLPLKTEVKAFDFYQQMACFGLNLDNDKADLLFINLKTGSVKPYHFDPNKNARISMLSFDNQKRAFIAVVKFFDTKSFSNDRYFHFTTKGIVSEEVEISKEDPSKLLRNFRHVSMSDSVSLLLGTFDLIQPKTYRITDYDNKNEQPSSGFFSILLVHGKQRSLHYFNFLNFKNIQGTFANRTYKMPKKREQKAPIASLLNVAQPKITMVNGKAVYSIEAYKASYRTETRIDYDFYGRAFPYTYEVFDGYEFYDVILAGFSTEGTMLWDNEFPLQTAPTFQLYSHAMIYPFENKIVAAYVQKGDIYSQMIAGSPDGGGVDKIPIASKFARDRVLVSDNGHIAPWYANYFLVYGYQKVSNRAMNKKERTVFFVNKVALQ